MNAAYLNDQISIVQDDLIIARLTGCQLLDYSQLENSIWYRLLEPLSQHIVLVKLLAGKRTHETLKITRREVAKVRLPIISHVLASFQASSQLLPRRVKCKLLILQCLARLLEVGTNLLIVVGLDRVACGIAKG